MRKRDQAGVSMIELMIAMVVIAVALLQVVGVIMHTTNVKQETRFMSIAKEAATDKVNEIRASNYDNIVLNFGGQNFDVNGLPHSNNPAGNNMGFGLVTIDGTNPDLLDVHVRIEWEGLKGKFTSYETRSLMTR